MKIEKQNWKFIKADFDDVLSINFREKEYLTSFLFLLNFFEMYFLNETKNRGTYNKLKEISKRFKGTQLSSKYQNFMDSCLDRYGNDGENFQSLKNLFMWDIYYYKTEFSEDNIPKSHTKHFESCKKVIQGYYNHLDIFRINAEDLIFCFLLITYAFRDKIFHGFKCIQTDQYKNFIIQINSVFQLIIKDLIDLSIDKKITQGE